MNAEACRRLESGTVSRLPSRGGLSSSAGGRRAQPSATFIDLLKTFRCLRCHHPSFSGCSPLASMRHGLAWIKSPKPYVLMRKAREAGSEDGKSAMSAGGRPLQGTRIFTGKALGRFVYQARSPGGQPSNHRSTSPWWSRCHASCRCGGKERQMSRDTPCPTLCRTN